MKNNAWTCVVFCVALVAADWQLSPAHGQREKQPVQKWEYKVVIANAADDATLNGSAADGWELVSALPSGEYAAHFYFKRPK